MKLIEREDQLMTREEALKMIEGLTDDDLILFRDAILEKMRNPASAQDQPREDQATN